MLENTFERFFEERFGKKAQQDPAYFEEWKGRLSGLRNIAEIHPAMDCESRRVWGKVTGQRLAFVQLIGWEGPVYQLVDLETGLDIGGAVKEMSSYEHYCRCCALEMPEPNKGFDYRCAKCHEKAEGWC